MEVYETVHINLMDYACMLLCCRRIHFQLVTALIIVLTRCVHTFTCDIPSQYNTDDFNCQACFFYVIIEFGFRVYFLFIG